MKLFITNTVLLLLTFLILEGCLNMESSVFLGLPMYHWPLPAAILVWVAVYFDFLLEKLVVKVEKCNTRSWPHWEASTTAKGVTVMKIVSSYGRSCVGLLIVALCAFASTAFAEAKVYDAQDIAKVSTVDLDVAVNCTALEPSLLEAVAESTKVFANVEYTRAEVTAPDARGVSNTVRQPVSSIKSSSATNNPATFASSYRYRASRQV